MGELREAVEEVDLIESELDSGLREALLADLLNDAGVNGDCGDVEVKNDGKCTSPRRTTSEMLRRFRTNLLETYSKAVINCVGRCSASSNDWPASRGCDM